MKAWLAFWREINTPHDYPADPYGELTNQVSHMAFGLLMAALVSVVWQWLFGEYPYKLAVSAIVTLPYLIGEVVVQRWRGWDTVADTFFYGIGAYGLLTGLDEIQVADRVLLESNAPGALTAFALFCIVMIARLAPRVRAKFGAK